jgi:hypothetical protein
MLVVSLSNHPAALLREAQKLRGATERSRQLAHDDLLAAHRDRLAQARADRRRARAQHCWGSWLRGILAVARLRRAAPQARRPQSRPSDEEAKLAAGMAGESLVEDALSSVLNDGWTLLRGYRNRRGEIDHLLLGPRGLFAIEGKHRNATVDCAGDRWWATKYDKYGNKVASPAEMTDGRGRSPSQQLNEPASELETFLGRRGHPVTISRIVVLTHPRARLRNCTGPTVHIATSIRQITDLLGDSPEVINAAERTAVQRLIIRDHRFHELRRPARTRR